MNTINHETTVTDDDIDVSRFENVRRDSMLIFLKGRGVVDEENVSKLSTEEIRKWYAMILKEFTSLRLGDAREMLAMLGSVGDMSNKKNLTYTDA